MRRIMRLFLSLGLICTFCLFHTTGTAIPLSPPQKVVKFHKSVLARSNIIKQRNAFGSPYSPLYDFNYYDKHVVRDDFLTRDSRRGFINKVYTIFGSQILTTMLVVNYIMHSTAATAYMQHNQGTVSLVSSIVTVGSLFGLMNGNMATKTPHNFILLAIFTLAQAISVGSYTVFINPSIVLTAAMHTLTAFLGITLVSSTSSTDLTLSGGTLSSILSSLLVGSVLNIFFRIPVLQNIISAVFAVVAAAYIYYDTQMIVGGKHHTKKYRSSEYILAALSLYQDVVMLFVELLKILQRIENNKRKNQDE